MGQDRNDTHILRGALAGVAGGLVASYVMNQFQATLSQAEQAYEHPGEPPPQQQSQQPRPDDATEKTADAIARATTHKSLSREKKEVLGPAVHCGFGAAMGGLYGAVAEYSSSSRIGFGTLFGTLLFFGADEIAVPALGLSKSPKQQPLTAQLPPWLAHVVYGATVELVRRAVRPAL